MNCVCASVFAVAQAEARKNIAHQTNYRLIIRIRQLNSTLTLQAYITQTTFRMDFRPVE